MGIKFVQKILAVVIATQFVTAQIFAAIPNRDRGVNVDLSLVTVSYSGQGIDFSRIAQFQPDGISVQDVSRMIPTNMNPSNNGSQVASQIFDQSMQSLFNSEAFKASDLGKTTHKVEKSMQQDISIGGTAPDSIKHNFKFNMQAAQTKAAIDYSGFGNAQLSYKASGQELNLEIFHKVSNNMKIAYNHINTPNDQRDMVSFNLGF